MIVFVKCFIFFFSKLLINKVELENSVCVTRHIGDGNAIDRPKYRHSKSSCYNKYHRLMFINDPVVGYSATVRDDDLLLNYMMIVPIRSGYRLLHGVNRVTSLKCSWVSACCSRLWRLWRHCFQTCVSGINRKCKVSENSPSKLAYTS